MDGLVAEDGSVSRAELEARLGYTFREAGLLELALTHRSVAYEERGGGDAAPEKNKPGTDNEQLEFLGDAVLGMVVSEMLLAEFPDRDEGELTRIRAALVSRKRMAEMGAKMGLAEHLLLGKSAERSGARSRPALMANAAEAVLAAMYLDAVRAGDDPLKAIRGLAERLLLAPDLPQLREALREAVGRGALRDPKTLLQERVQAQGVGHVRYVDVEQSGPAHERRFVVEVRLEVGGEQRVLGSGEGASKRAAQQVAAERALVGWIPAEDAAR